MTQSKRVWVGIFIASMIFLSASYFLSPIGALISIVSAIRSADRDSLAVNIDFPSIRESLKGQFNAAFAKKAATDPELKGNPFAGLALMIVPMMVERIVDGYVTPDGVAALLKSNLDDSPTSSSTATAMRGAFDYMDADHFRATFQNPKQLDERVSLILERRGLMSWKLVRIDLPLQEIAQAAKGAEQNNDASSGQGSSQQSPAGNDSETDQPDASAGQGISRNTPSRRSEGPTAASPSNDDQSNNEPLPTVVGQCGRTTVKQVSTRLQNQDGSAVPGSGSAIGYENGGYQVSYDEIPGIDDSRPGDEVTVCLVSIPDHCPPGDDRGRVYHATNGRTGGQWDAADAEHMCGGA